MQDGTPIFEEDHRAPDEAGGDGLLLDLDGYEGPIDVLLALAREQKVDLTKISILQLADQYLDFISRARELRIDIRLIKRWRNGVRPDSAHLVALFSLAARLGLLHLLLPEVRKQVCAASAERKWAKAANENDQGETSGG